MKSLSLGLIIAFAGASTGAAQTQITQFVIEPGSTYTHTSAWISYPECGDSGVASNQCVFEISGSFNLVEDGVDSTAAFSDVEIKLNGIELESPVGLMTAVGVEGWLLDRDLAVGGVLDCSGLCQLYADEGLSLSLSAEGFGGWEEAILSGGFDSTPVDGPAIAFAVTARAVPEPSTLLLGAIALFTSPRTPRRSRAPSGRSAA